ncbi:MAG: hypothetical protein EA387_06050 [Nitriliruptor sp.]|nr:MAG: hypothetical protein EA387_06050 [Nitriliruptor sp.]
MCWRPASGCVPCSPTWSRLDHVATSPSGRHRGGPCRSGRCSSERCTAGATGRVHGVEGVAVADASIMPRIPRADTDLPTVMVAERIAQNLMTP